jgi:hypothetical protein
VFSDPTYADAILDRIVHNAYRLELDGPSIRKIKAGDAGFTPAAMTPTDANAAKGAKK